MQKEGTENSSVVEDEEFLIQEAISDKSSFLSLDTPDNQGNKKWFIREAEHRFSYSSLGIRSDSPMHDKAADISPLCLVIPFNI